MADSTITGLTNYTTPISTDVVPVVDVTNNLTKKSTMSVLQTFVLNIITTIGDLIYGGASGVPTRLAGNTSATKNFLTQTGTGSASAAPAWGTIAAGDIPTLNQSTTGSAATLTTPRSIAGTNFDGSANISLANKFIVQGTTDSGLSGPQFLGALSTGIVKNTTTTGVLSIAANSDLPAMTSTVGGAVPTPPNNTTTFLRGDGTFATPAGGNGTNLFDTATWTVGGHVPVAAQWTTSLVGSGAFVDAGNGAGVYLHASATGNTGTNVAYIYAFQTTAAAIPNGWNKNLNLRFIFNFNWDQASGISYLYLTGATTTGTANYMGLRLNSVGTVNFVTNDGTTEQITSVGGSFNTNTTSAQIIDLIYTAGTSVKCYINGSLIATNSTHIPLNSNTTDSLKLLMATTNGNTTNDAGLVLDNYWLQKTF